MGQQDYLTSLLGGLVTAAADAAPLRTSYAWPLHDSPSPDVATPPAHCWRSVGARTLSHPVLWGADIALGPFVSPYLGVVVPLGLPVVPVASPPILPAPPTQVGPFYDNNSDDRGPIDNLVLIGLRARATVCYGGKRPSNVTPWRRSNEWAKAIPDFLGHYLSLRVTHTPGGRDQWINETPLAYLNRPDRGFVAVPPLIWNTRDTKCDWTTRAPDVQGLPLIPPAFPPQTPSLAQFGAGDPIPMQVSATLMVEGLFIPDPDRCPDAWPGVWCPPQAIRGHRQFDPEFYQRRRAPLDKLARMLAALDLR